MDGLRATVLVINYNGAHHLPACLSALAEQTVPRHSFEVILLDNGSDDASAATIAERFPWVRFVHSPRNLGFAQGNQFAATFAHAPALILLNNDTIPDPFWLEELFHVMAEHPNAPVVSKLVFLHDPGLIQSAGLLLLRDGRGVDYGFLSRDLGQFEETRPVFAGCGAALAIPASIGAERLFDAHYFVYYEDTELGWSSTRRGFPTIYAPRAVVRHAHGASASQSTPFFCFHVERNRTLTALRHGDILLASLAVPGLLLRTVRAIVRALRGHTPWPVAWAFLRAVRSLSWHAPRMLWQRLIAS